MLDIAPQIELESFASTVESRLLEDSASTGSYC